MHELIHLIQSMAHDGAPTDEVTGRVISQVRVVFLGVHDSVEIPAVAHVNGNHSQVRAFHLEAFHVQE